MPNDTEVEQLIVWVGTQAKIDEARQAGTITDDDFVVVTDAPELQTKLTASNAGNGIAITEVGGVTKISNTQTSAEWGNILGTLSNQTDLQQALDLKLPTSTKYGSSLSLSIDPTTFVVTVQLKDQDGNNLGQAGTIDLPLESVVVGGRYDDTTKKVILTLENGSEIEFSIADLVAGLQTEITAQNKLNADYVDDSNSANKFTTTQEKATWNGKQDAINDLDTIRSGASAGATALQGVQVNGTNLTKDINNNVNIPVGTSSVLGVYKVNPNQGVSAFSSGDLCIISASEQEITAKTQSYKPIVPNKLDIAVREGLGNNSLTWTDAYKESARNTIGAEAQATIQTLSATDSITLSDNTIYNGGEQTALTIALPDTVDVSFICEIDFTSGTTPSTLSYPNTIKWIGDDVANNVFIPVASKRYTIIVAYDGVNYRATVKGV